MDDPSSAPVGPPVSFSKLRAKGGHIVTSAWNGSGVKAPVTLISEAGNEVTLVSPWGTASEPLPFCVTVGPGDAVQNLRFFEDRAFDNSELQEVELVSFGAGVKFLTLMYDACKPIPVPT